MNSFSGFAVTIDQGKNSAVQKVDCDTT